MDSVKPTRVLRTSFRVSGIAFSPSGLLAAAGIKTRRVVETSIHVTLWKQSAQEPMATFTHPGWQVRVGFSADEAWLVLVANIIFLHDVRTAELVARIGRENCGIRDWAFSSDNQWLAVGFEDGQVQLLRMKRMLPAQSLEVGSKEYTLAFSPDCRSVVITTELRGRGVMRLYALPDLELERTVQSGQHGAVLATYFGADGSSLVLVSEDGTISVWSPGQDHAMIRSVELPAEVWSLCLSPDAQRLVVSGCKTLKNRNNRRFKSQGIIDLYRQEMIPATPPANGGHNCRLSDVANPRTVGSFSKIIRLPRSR